MSGKQMTARYPGQCACGAAISAGDRILFAGRVAGCKACEFGAVEARAITEQRAQQRAALLEKPFLVRTYWATNAPGLYGWASHTDAFATEAEARDHATAKREVRTVTDVRIERMGEAGGELTFTDLETWKRPRSAKRAA